MGRMKRTGFIAATIFLMFFIACGGGGGGSSSNNQPNTPGQPNNPSPPNNPMSNDGSDLPPLLSIEKASIRFLFPGTYEGFFRENPITKMDQDMVYIVTFDNYGNRLRMDLIAERDGEIFHAAVMSDRITETSWTGASYLGETKWEDSLLRDASFEKILGPLLVGDHQGSFIGKVGMEYLQPYKQPNETIAGISCDVYIFQEECRGDDCVSHKFAFLNDELLMSFSASGFDEDLGFFDFTYLETTHATLVVPNEAFTKTMNITWLD